jgi:hypothetical protein
MPSLTRPKMPSFKVFTTLFDDSTSKEVSITDKTKIDVKSITTDLDSNIIYEDLPEFDIKNIALDEYQNIIDSLTNNLMVCEQAKDKAFPILNECIANQKAHLAEVYSKKKEMQKAVDDKWWNIWFIKRNRIIDETYNLISNNLRNLLQNFK